METYSYRTCFDRTRKADHVVVESAENIASWKRSNGSIYGDEPCVRNRISYWEIIGSEYSTHAGIAEDIHRAGMLVPGAIYESNAYLLSNPGCNRVPGLMYSSLGFVTNGKFRGPKPCLPTGVYCSNVTSTTAVVQNTDRLGILVNLCHGYVMFLLNDRPQTMPIPLNKNKQYFPFVSDTSCRRLELRSGIEPQWEAIFDDVYMSIQTKL